MVAATTLPFGYFAGFDAMNQPRQARRRGRFDEHPSVRAINL
jgi:hypothetical protein